jgi:hypothetical protein
MRAGSAVLFMLAQPQDTNHRTKRLPKVVLEAAPKVRGDVGKKTVVIKR